MEVLSVSFHAQWCHMKHTGMHNTVPQQGTQLLSPELQQQGFPALLPQPTPSEGFSQAGAWYQPHTKHPPHTNGTWGHLCLWETTEMALGSIKYTQTFNHPQLFPRFFIPPDIEFCHSWNNWSSEKLLHPELPALQEFIVSSKIVSASAVPVVYLSFEENVSTQASYDHLTLQTLVGIDSWSPKFTQSIKYTPLLMKHADHLSSVTLLWQKEGRCQRVLCFNISASWSILRPQSWAWNCLR